MKKDLSVYLDILRVLAAGVVFLAHVSSMKNSGGFLWQFQNFGHPAVIVFFVLSGYLIQYSVTARENTLLDYTVARLGRLYSVVIPALLLTYAFDRIGAAYDPDAYVSGYQTYPLVRLLAGTLFLNQSWMSLPMFSNLPFWSLPYEFWYYALFGAVIFLRGWKRWLTACACGLVAGPAILLFLPIWLMGVGAFRAGAALRLKPVLAAAIFAATSLAAVVFIAESYKVLSGNHIVYLPPDFSPADYILGLVLALNLVAAAQLRLPLAALERPAKWLAGMTFTLYLFHVPLVHLTAGLFSAIPQNWIRAASVSLVVFLAVWLLSFATEKKRYLWNRLFRRLLSPLAAATRAHALPDEGLVCSVEGKN